MKKAYLTIDDAPSEDFRRKVDYLFKRNIPAIFFIQGNFAEKRKNDLVYAIKKGFILGNHSWNHENFQNLDIKECENEIVNTDKLIEEVYKKAKVKRKFKLFRFPELDCGAGYISEKKNYWSILKVKQIQKILKRLCYKQPNFSGIKYKWWKKFKLDKCLNVDCTYDTFDWAVIEKNPPYGYTGLKELIARMEEDFPEEGRGLNFKNSNEIIMMHDHPQSKELFIPLIKGLLAKGIKFEKIS